MRVSVVVPTRDRPDRLARALAALRRQTLPGDDYEIVVVDDGSGPATRALLEATPGLRVLRHETSRGPAAARNTGWRAASAPLVAFTDDDCEVTPGWLESLAAAAGERRFVQGPTLPHPGESAGIGAFSHTVRVEALGPWWETANILYPREGLEFAGGFDEEHYSGPGGEDTDLGWTLLEAGYAPVWAPGARVHHAVTRLSPIGKLRLAWRWDETMRVFKRHPELRRHLIRGIFWQRNHWWLVRALMGLLLPRRLSWIRWWLAAPYSLRLGTLRPHVAAFLVVHDLVEMAACARGALRYRVLVL